MEPRVGLDTRQPGLPPELVELVADCLEIDPGDRPRDGDAVAARLEALLEETGAETLVANQPLVSTTMPMRTIAALRPASPWWQVHAWSALLVARTMLCAGSVGPGARTGRFKSCRPSSSGRWSHPHRNAASSVSVRHRQACLSSRGGDAFGPTSCA